MLKRKILGIGGGSSVAAISFPKSMCELLNIKKGMYMQIKTDGTNIILSPCKSPTPENPDVKKSIDGVVDELHEDVDNWESIYTED